MKVRVWSVLALLGVTLEGHGAVLVSGFAETVFPLPGVSAITDIEWAPDASRRLFIAQKDGGVRIMRQTGELLAMPFTQISPLYTDSECGLVGLCFDPNFLVNHYVYFFVTVSASEQQIIRYEDANNVGVNKTVLIGNLPTIGANHDGGGMAVGLDGKLYFSIGDLGTGIGVDADLTSLASKVSRRNLDGTIPQLNPFVDGPGGNNDSIWARGFRNPFKLAVQPSTGLIWVDVTGGAYEQVFSVQKGDHAGWNDYENDQPAGYIKPRIKYRTNGTDTRQFASGGIIRHDNVITFTTTAAHGFRKGERVTVTGVLDPSFNGSFYVTSIPTATTFTVDQIGPHVVSDGGTVATLAMGGAITGGCFYNANAFPDNYRQNYIFCDFNSGRINRATIDTTNEVTSVDYFINGISGAVDVTTGPNGHLYYVGYFQEAIYRLVSTNGAQKIVASPNYLNMSEGGRAVINIRLGAAPAADVIVTVTPPAAKPQLSSTNLSLTFTPANWSDTQPIYIDALADNNPFHTQGTFTLSAAGFSSRPIYVNAYDPEHGNLAFTSVVRTNETTRLQLATEQKTRAALERSTNLIFWQPFSTNTFTTNAATVIDTLGPGPQRFYRARTLP